MARFAEFWHEVLLLICSRNQNFTGFSKPTTGLNVDNHSKHHNVEVGT